MKEQLTTVFQPPAGLDVSSACKLMSNHFNIGNAIPPNPIGGVLSQNVNLENLMDMEEQHSRRKTDSHS